MTDHDPLCPWANEPKANRDHADCPFCPQIEAVRADERERIAQAIEAMPGSPNAGTRDAAARIARNALRAGSADE